MKRIFLISSAQFARFESLYTATLVIAKAVIPAKAGIQKNTGFRVEPGMTNRIRLISSCIAIIRVIRRGCHSGHLTSVEKSLGRIALVDDFPIAEVNIPMDDQV
jgi:hypothetical protein